MSVNWLELAETRLPAIIGKLRGDTDVLDNGRRFHDLAGEYLPRVVRERESFIELLENLASLEKRILALLMLCPLNPRTAPPSSWNRPRSICCLSPTPG